MTTATDRDATLVEASKRGDFAAFEQLVDHHSPRLFSLAMSIVRQREDAEDVVQTSFMNALEHIESFRGDSSFATWIARIATNNALKNLRKRRGAETVPLDDGGDAGAEIPHPDFIADWRNDPLATLERSEVRTLLAGGIDELPEGQRLVFALRDIQGLSIAETADALGITQANVKVRLLRARLALRERLTRAFGDPSTRAMPMHGHGPGHDALEEE